MTETDLITTAEQLDAAFRVLASRGIRQKQIAEDLGRSETAVSQWRNGVHRVPKYAALHLRTAYGITVATVTPTAA